MNGYSSHIIKALMAIVHDHFFEPHDEPFLYKYRTYKKAPPKTGGAFLYVVRLKGLLPTSLWATLRAPFGREKSFLTIFSNLGGEQFLAKQPYIKKPTKNWWVFLCMVRLKGFEPLTARFVAEYSIQLSYRRKNCRCFCEDALSRFMLVASM